MNRRHHCERRTALHARHAERDSSTHLQLTGREASGEGREEAKEGQGAEQCSCRLSCFPSLTDYCSLSLSALQSNIRSSRQAQPSQGGPLLTSQPELSLFCSSLSSLSARAPRDR